jgi:hypothetical protein
VCGVWETSAKLKIVSNFFMAEKRHEVPMHKLLKVDADESNDISISGVRRPLGTRNAFPPPWKTEKTFLNSL